jgi:hypothetical protein
VEVAHARVVIADEAGHVRFGQPAQVALLVEPRLLQPCGVVGALRADDLLQSKKYQTQIRKLTLAARWDRFRERSLCSESEPICHFGASV